MAHSVQMMRHYSIFFAAANLTHQQLLHETRFHVGQRDFLIHLVLMSDQQMVQSTFEQQGDLSCRDEMLRKHLGLSAVSLQTDPGGDPGPDPGQDPVGLPDPD